MSPRTKLTASNFPLTRAKLMRRLMLPEDSQTTVVARKVVRDPAEVTVEVVNAEVASAEVETRVSATPSQEVVTEAIAEVAEVENAESPVSLVSNASHVSPVSPVSLVSVDLKVKIAPGLPDLPEQRVVTILDKTITVKEEEVVPVATEVASEVAAVVRSWLLPVLAELTSDLSVRVSSEVDSEVASEATAVVSEVREERVATTDPRASLDTMKVTIPEAEVAREEPAPPVVATAPLAVVMPPKPQVPSDDHRAIF